MNTEQMNLRYESKSHITVNLNVSPSLTSTIQGFPDWRCSWKKWRVVNKASENADEQMVNWKEWSKVAYIQALMGTRYPTQPKFYFYYLYPLPGFFLHFRVQGSSYTCCFQSRIISTMMPANQLRRKRNSLKIVKIERNAEHKPTHLQFRMDIWHYSSFLFMSFGNIVLKTLCGQSSLGHRLTFSVIFIWKVVFPLTVKSGTMLLFCHEAITHFQA